MLDDLLLRDVELQGSPGLVRVLLEEDVPPVMEIHLRLAPADRRLILDAAQLPLRIALVDRDEGHLAARVDEHAVMGLRRREGEDVHEADREFRIRDRAAVHEDAAAVQDMPRLPGVRAHLQHVPEDQAQRDARIDRVRTGRRLHDPEIRLPRDRPAAGGRQPLQMLLHGRITPRTFAGATDPCRPSGRSGGSTRATAGRPSSRRPSRS